MKTGLTHTDQERFHFDIYAILEGPQELYFGHETQVNVNVVETVTIQIGDSDDDTIEKCYMSPTKRRGVERRTLIWAPVGNEMLGDQLNCGIPHTCSQEICPICSVYGGLITSKTSIDTGDGQKVERDATTLIGRLTHGGGTAIQPLDPEEKQRAMHPSKIHQGEKAEKIMPMPYKKEYNEPGLLYPVYNHCLSMTDKEFASVAYAFLSVLPRIGAGNPKGVKILDYTMISDQLEPVIVFDRYRIPLGKRPVISPQTTAVKQALDQFQQATFSVSGQSQEPAGEINNGSFTRYVGDRAIQKLSEYLVAFEAEVLNTEN